MDMLLALACYKILLKAKAAASNISIGLRAGVCDYHIVVGESLNI